MLIVNQDKDEIINFNHISNIWINSSLINDGNDFEIYANDSLLGFYKTEERAKEVLQEIIMRYKNWENLKAGQPTGLCLPVYEMPEE